MIRAVRAFLARRRERRLAEAFQRGRDWANGVLVSGELSYDEVEAIVYSPWPQSEESDAFDEGAVSALLEWRGR